MSYLNVDVNAMHIAKPMHDEVSGVVAAAVMLGERRSGCLICRVSHEHSHLATEQSHELDTMIGSLGCHATSRTVP